MRTFITFDVNQPELLKKLLLQYIQHVTDAAVYDCCAYYDVHHSDVDYHTFDYMAGIGAVKFVSGSFNSLEKLSEECNDWLLGYLGYDLKNDFEKLYSVNKDGINFPPLYFFQPRYLIVQRGKKWELGFLTHLDTEETVKIFLDSIYAQSIKDHENPTILFTERVSKERYCQAVNSILEHIQKGDVYELNYCMEFYAEDATINPYEMYQRLVQISPTPFAAFFKSKDHYVISASPERYLKKEGKKLISQPIKGTAKRGMTEEEDLIQKDQLKQSVKEQSENIMIADLVRNDLSRVAARGSVEVEELCGIYPFKQVFQMITTVVANLDANKGGLEAIRASFPMGSMTGAPKVRAMKLIEKYEETKRSLYSGAIGYFTPDGDFDFNVVIRSLLYNAANRYLSFMVGSAITEKSVAEQEYEECLLKAKAILTLFNQEKPLTHA
jgi:para-aminobenzoate synthetase component 1